MKSKVAIVTGLLVLTFLTPIIYFFASVPREQIDTLEKGYVETQLEGETPVYTFVKKKPKNWKDLDQISSHVKHAIIVSEDWAFYSHDGVDYLQLQKAVGDHFTKGEKLRGASTISQQLVKNLFLTNERTLSRKLKEVFITKYLESKLSKDKILEVYLNIIQYGDKLYGIQNAAKFYFKKNASQLNAREAAFLAMLLPNPKKYSQSFRDKKLSEFAQKTMDEILVKMRQAKFLSKEQYTSAAEADIGWNRGKSFQANSHNLRARSGSGLSDGSEYEENMKYDRDLQVKELKYDDDAMVEDLSGLESEFQVED